MKKWLLAFALLAGSVGAFAEDMDADSSDGCGPGWYIYPDKTLVGTSIRQTTNNIIPGAISGMSSGTSNCTQHDIVKSEKASLHYTAANYETIINEMAQGQGEFLSEYARVLGCDETQFSNLTQEKFESIVPNEQNSKELLDNVKKEIVNNALNCAV